MDTLQTARHFFNNGPGHRKVWLHGSGALDMAHELTKGLEVTTLDLAALNHISAPTRVQMLQQIRDEVVRTNNVLLILADDGDAAQLIMFMDHVIRNKNIRAVAVLEDRWSRTHKRTVHIPSPVANRFTHLQV